MKKRSTTVVVVILTLIMTFMEMSALPAALFCNVKIKEIHEYAPGDSYSDCACLGQPSGCLYIASAFKK